MGLARRVYGRRRNCGTGGCTECLEETGLEVALDGLHTVYSYQHANRTTSGLLILYRAHVIGGSPRAGTDTMDVKFFAADEISIDMLAFETHRHAIEQILGLNGNG